MRMIACVPNDFGIGHKGRLLFNIEEDIKHFRELTRGGVVIMGSRTADSLPGGKPLKDCIANIVITHQTGVYAPLGFLEMYTVEDVIRFGILNDLKSRTGFDDRMWVIGGEQIYKQLLPFCSEIYLTFVNISVPCDTYFPNIRSDPDWEIADASEWFHDDNVEFRFERYRKCLDIHRYLSRLQKGGNIT